MKFRIRFTEEARADLKRLYAFALEQANGDWSHAERALDAVVHGVAQLQGNPFACRKVGDSPLLRELVIGYGSNGYLALFEIMGDTTVTVLAVRHQREDDYH